MAQALQVEQQHGVALAAGKLVDGAPDARGEVGEFRRFGRPGDSTGPVGLRPRHLGPQVAQPPAGHIQRDAAEPRAEPVGRPELAQVRHGRDRGLLHGVSGQIRRAQDSGGQEGRGAPVAPQQHRERVPASAERLAHKVGVRPAGVWRDDTGQRSAQAPICPAGARLSHVS